MTLQDFQNATALFGPGKLTAFLQGGLSVTGTWDWLEEPVTRQQSALHPNGVKVYSTSVVMTDGNDTRHVVPIETITSLREVKTWTKPKPLTAAERKAMDEIERKLAPPALSGRKPGFMVFDEVG